MPTLLGVISKQSLPLEKPPFSWSSHQKRNVTVQCLCKETHGLCCDLNTEMLVTGSLVEFPVCSWWLHLVGFWKLRSWGLPEEVGHGEGGAMKVIPGPSFPSVSLFPGCHDVTRGPTWPPHLMDSNLQNQELK